MTEISLDRIISEDLFAGALSTEAEMFFRLANTLRSQVSDDQRRLQTYQLGIEADLVEVFLDDHGAKNNQSYWFLRELVASIRGFARVGFALGHLQHRLDGYGTLLAGDASLNTECLGALGHARGFVRESICCLLDACKDEAVLLGVSWDERAYPEGCVSAGPVNLRLPHNLGEDVIEEEDRRVAEVASKYLQVCAMLGSAGIHRLTDAAARETLLAKSFTEERARVYEATVHNLQSTYDTYLKSSTLEREDPRLPCLRGHVSASFHMLEAVTDLMHFVERHEASPHRMGQGKRIAELIDRASVEEVVLNDLLFWAQKVLLLGEEQARAILSSYSQLQELQLPLPEGLTVHARPASLIVAVVNHHEMPVEMEVNGNTCNAASILEVLICSGSNPDATQYTFRGDARPLADLAQLFEAGLGEHGLALLPESLGYLVQGS